MNQERSPSQNRFSWNLENNRIARSKNLVEQTKLLKATPVAENLSNCHQVTSLHQPLWFWSQHSLWSNFNRGLFWGGLIGLTAVISAAGGVALTKIDPVERAIANQIGVTQTPVLSLEQSLLSRPIDILLIEVASDANNGMELSPSLRGKAQNVLLLRFKPQANLLQVIDIPLDSSVKIPGLGRGTVRDAYEFGGIKLLTQAVNQLMNGSMVDRYIRATPEVFQQLTASGKVAFSNCDFEMQNCSDRQQQILRQQTAVETIRQRLNIPSYLANFQAALIDVEPKLDTDLPRSHILSLANFIKELEPNRIRVNLISEYIPGKTLAELQPPTKSLSAEVKQSTKSITAIEHLQSNPIAVQNTTEHPELGMRVVAYLRDRDFQDVYLIEHIPLKLDRTKIIANDRQLETANYLKSVLGLGNLEAIAFPQRLTLQIGEDAFYLPLEHR